MQQLERVTNLLTLLISARRPVTFEEIRNELRGQYPDNLSAARAAFERDKAILRQEGVPIEQSTLGGDQAGQMAYRVSRSAYEAVDFGLDDDEARALRLAVGAVRLGTTWSRDALWKVDLAGDVARDASGDGAPVAASIPVDPRLPALHRALAQRSTVSFSYRGKARRLQPHGLLARDGWWYVVGHDLEVDAQRTYRVDRIEGDVSVGDAGSYSIPADFRVRDSFPSDPKLLPDNVDVGSDVAVVRIDPSDVGVVLGQYGRDAVVAENPDGSFDFNIPCSNVQAFNHWLFGFLERAEVVSPPALRALVVEWLEDLVKAPL